MTKYLNIAYAIFDIALLLKSQDIFPKLIICDHIHHYLPHGPKLRDKITWNQVKFTKFALENMSYAFLNT